MSRASWNVVLDGVLESFERTPDFGLGGRFVGFEEGSQKLVLELDVEDGDADAFVGEDVGVFVRQVLDEP